MTRPRLLDLFCGAGGAAVGYHRAGFDVVGVDVAPQPRYPFAFHLGDALTFPLAGFDAIHASPPCQGYSAMRHLPWLAGRDYPMLLGATFTRLGAAGVPYVIENVERAPMPWSAVLCGTMFGLPLYRHRRFGSNLLLLSPPHSPHRHVIAHGRSNVSGRLRGAGGVVGVHRNSGRHLGTPRILGVAGHSATGGTIAEAQAAMGIDWMRRDELTQAIPPAYTEWLGEQVLAAIAAR